MTVTNSRTASDPVEDVVVIGAGVAGLTAAYELRAHSPLVLEADDIIGGRVRTVDVEGVPMNLGAEYWVNAPGDPYPRGLLAEIGVELTSRMDDGRGGLVIGGQHIAATSADELADGLGFSAAARDDLVRTSGRVAATIDRLWTSADGAQLGAELMTTSAADWLGTVDPAVRRLYDDLAMITPGSALDHLHALSFIVLIPSIGGTAGHQWGAEVILGGSARLAQALASRGSRPPVLGAHVVDVSAADEVSGPTAGARVRYFRDGELHAVTARHVIVATPASVAAAMCRTLPDWKLGALREVSYAAWSSVDVVAEFDDPVSWASSGTIPFLDGPVSLLLNNGPIGDDRTLAVRLLTGGVRAEPYFDSGIERLQALCCAQFADVFAACRAIRPGTSRMWVSGAPHFRWGSTYGTRANVAALLQSVGQIHFCGDYMGFVDAESDGGFGSGADIDFRTTTYMSTAMRSGRRSAEATRAALARRHAGHHAETAGS